MEHLSFEDGTPSPIVVPLLSMEKYDGGDFLTYPERAGWDISTWKWSTPEEGFDLNGRTISEMSAFLQTWLFFGLLASATGIKISEGDFVCQNPHGDHFITTRRLAKSLDEWKDRIGHLDPEEKKKEDDRSEDCIIEASTVNDMLTFLLSYGENLGEIKPLKQTLFAQMLLVEALKGASYQIFLNRRKSTDSNRDMLLREKLLEAGWCCSIVDFMQEKLPLQIQALAYSLSSVRTHLDHTPCQLDQTSGCKFSQVGQNYQPKHVNSSCQCAFVYCPTDEIVGMLKENKIPLITIKRSPAETASPSLELVIDGIDLDHPEFAQYGCPYVAITHVWSDGLGNITDNSLPHCQIERIESMTRTLQGTVAAILTESFGMTAHHSGTVPLWFDTLCIPVQKEYQNLRDFSIQKMRDIYQKAAGVLVLDPDIQQLKADVSSLEILTRILCSGWRARLWTYQEGALASYLHIPVQGRSFTFITDDDIFPADDTKASLIECQLLTDVWYLYHNLVRISEVRTDSFERPQRAFTQMMRAMSHRSTTRQGDETVCIATFLGLDPTPILKTPVEDRMATLMTLLPVIPTHILFTNGRRLTKEGFRWVPESLLSPYGLKDFIRFSLPQTYFPGATMDPINTPIPQPFIHSQALGLAVFFPGIILSRASYPIPETFSITTSEGTRYVVEAHDTGTDTPWSLLSPDKLEQSAILLTDLGKGKICLFVELIGQSEEKEYLASWKRLVAVDKLDGSDEVPSAEVAEQHCLRGEYVHFTWWIVD
ncbi:hypothetical protein AOQ84DRAFT_407815 [Glonium stellatum]|uniref:Heterokaryon incompatibility domain-containing protein n=1 Tax=Glonium stellatum TaxID=574774 RepID=A0A8E2JYD7_9PEZI|nr:hypothetical protein AOQ84DRAFT_407815 [Glonium stellatum]